MTLGLASNDDLKKPSTLTRPNSVQAIATDQPLRIDAAVIEAIGLQNAGRLAEAERLYRGVFAAQPDHALALYGFGLLRTRQGRLADAAEAYRRALAVRPDLVDAYINLGTVVLGLGQTEAAVDLYRQAIALSPDNAMGWGNLGKALHDLGRLDEALAAYHAGIARQPDNAMIHVNLGAALLHHQSFNQAVTVTSRAVELDPANPMAHANLGMALLGLGQNDQALAACRRAVALQPRGAEIHSSLGGAMLELGAWTEAAALCRDAIAFEPGLANAHFNLSHALKAMNQLQEAESAVRQAIALRPDAAEFHFHLAHVLLLRGELQAGWEEYEWRLKLPAFAWISALFGACPQPLWAGQDIEEKTILIYTEQGLGDIIQFARYLPLLVKRAGRVIVAAQTPMRRLLQTIEGITIVPMRQAPLQVFDVHCPLLSLPRAFATELHSIPVEVRYLHAEPAGRARWDSRIGGDALRVGIVWAGSPTTKRDRFRSPGLGSVAPLFSVAGVDFVVLQVGAGRADCDTYPLPAHVLDLGREVTDLADTAAIMAGLDLMISSCTGPLHLAGALGVPTWAMIPFAPHFPWLLDRTDSVWYRNMILYRQDQPGQDWSVVVSRIASDLAVLAGSRQPAAGSRREFIPTGHTNRAPLGATPLAATPLAATPGAAIPGAATPGAGGCNEIAACRDGLMLFNRNDIYIGASLRKYGEFSGDETELFRTIVSPGMAVLDIGANIGVHTVALSALVGSAGAVHAFEPQRLIFQTLCANLALNGRSNVFTHHAAVGAAEGRLLVPSLDPDGSHNYGGLSLAGAQQGEAVPMLSIDGLGLDVCHLIKIDVEGMETEALQGAAVTIARLRPMLYVENDREARSAELIDLIQSYGYRLYWHLPRLYRSNNFRADPENIFGNTISVNMLCLPVEMPQSALTGLREVTGPGDIWHRDLV